MATVRMLAGDPRAVVARLTTASEPRDDVPVRVMALMPLLVRVEVAVMPAKLNAAVPLPVMVVLFTSVRGALTL